MRHDGGNHHAHLWPSLRPVSAWRAMDRGTRLYRQWHWPITALWLIATAPFIGFALVITLISGSAWPLLVFWWLKPLWERPLLSFYADVLLAPRQPLRRYIRQWPQQCQGLLSQLSWRRLSLKRSMLTPLWQLERADRQRIPERLRSLRQPPAPRAMLLTVLVLQLEQLITLAVLALVLLPLWTWDNALPWLLAPPPWLVIVAALAWYAAMTLTQPLYVACGLMLYLNQRSHQEGWDLQLMLQDIAARLVQRSSSRGAALLLFAVIAAPLTMSDAQAAETHDNRAEAPKETVIRQLARDEWTRIDIQQRRHFRFLDREHSRVDLSRWQQWLSNSRQTASGWRGSYDLLLRGAVWSLLAMGVLASLWMIWRYRHQRPRLALLQRRRPPRLTRQQLDDGASEATPPASRIDSKASLNTVIEHHLTLGLGDTDRPLQPGETYGQAWQRGALQLPAEAQHHWQLLGDLIRHWQHQVWAAKHLDNDALERLMQQLNHTVVSHGEPS